MLLMADMDQQLTSWPEPVHANLSTILDDDALLEQELEDTNYTGQGVA